MQHDGDGGRNIYYGLIKDSKSVGLGHHTTGDKIPLSRTTAKGRKIMNE